MKRKLTKIALALTATLILILLIDIFLFRGFFFEKIFFEKDYGELHEAPTNVHYNIQKKGDNYTFTFKNNSYKPYYFWTYRWEKVIQKVPDTLFFIYARRIQIDYPHLSTEFYYGFDCGTGVGMTAIRPQESFQIDLSYQELLDGHYYIYEHINAMNELDSIAKDLYHQKPLVKIVNNRFTILENESIKNTDSVNIRFYLPIFSPVKGHLSYVKSNPIKVSYLDIVKEIKKEQAERAKYY